MRDPLHHRFDSLISDIAGFVRGYLSSSTETHHDGSGSLFSLFIRSRQYTH